jgi:hypothetical protein
MLEPVPAVATRHDDPVAEASNEELAVPGIGDDTGATWAGRGSTSGNASATTSDSSATTASVSVEPARSRPSLIP